MTIQDRPTASELLEAVRELLERDILPAHDGRIAFHVRVALNALTIVERELVFGPEIDQRIRAQLSAFLGEDEPLPALVERLARGIRDGAFDDRDQEVLDVTRDLVRAKLEITNPTYTRAITT